MEFNNIKALVPVNEDFDASAVNEGVWLSEAHLAAIETSLENNTTLVGELRNTITEHATAVQTANDALATANETITAHESTIQSLNEQIATLKQAPAGEGKNTSKEKDELGGGGIEIVSEVTQEAAKLRALRDGK